MGSNGQLYGQYQTWVRNTLNETTGTNGNWSYGASTANGEGWWCTRTCLLNNQTSAGNTPIGTHVGGEYVQTCVGLPLIYYYSATFAILNISDPISFLP